MRRPWPRAPIGRDGVFHATALQAKCASKYAPAQPGATPGNKLLQPPIRALMQRRLPQPGSAPAGNRHELIA